MSLNNFLAYSQADPGPLVTYSGVKALEGVTLEVNGGETVSLVGPNGAGKTTLVEMIEGIQLPDKGDIFIMGKKWAGNEDEFRRTIGLPLASPTLL
jgi:ABC-2 type transport system ATP-binding protein